ncbi:MAG TPA: DapH/DapD/GlmU-related protein [Candidatus Limnocylindrales bacterium]|nr:DapH/DapD/GlmU-related protein [Candidatus Limnocylindrales bacterium]
MDKPQTKFQSSLTDIRKSAIQKYRNTVVGKEDVFSLIRYELITSLLGGLPGAVGFLLRQIFYRSLFAQVGHGVVFGRYLTLRHPHKIKIGHNVIIDDYCLLDAKGCKEGDFILGNNVLISRNCILSCKEGFLRVGDNTNFGANCSLYSVSRIDIGSDVLFAANCYIGGSMYYFHRTDMPPIQQGSYSKGGVVIGDGCWLGADVKVLDGVKIGPGTIVGAGAVVLEDVESFSIVAGVPAKLIRKRI